MNIAVVTLTRDRVDYTRHCLSMLRENAGCDYDHYVLDQGSTDGTVEWLLSQPDLDVTTVPENIGIPAGMNVLLDVCNPGDYDVVVKFDNDCELTETGTLARVCELVDRTGWLLSPRILGLRNPPQPIGEAVVDGERILLTPIIGGIFLAAPSHAYSRFRFPVESLPTWGYDDSMLCDRWRQHGGQVGYVDSLEAWHYEGTTKQWERYPDYFARAEREGKVLA